MKLAVDTLGGDLGSPVIVKAIKSFLSKHNDVEIIAFGKKEELAELEGIATIVDAPEVVPMEAGALEVLRMKNSSMLNAVKQMKENGYDGVVSCGSTGAFLSSATITLKLIPGIKRAALVAPFPTKIKGKKVIILDIGASNENSGEELYQFAKMGRLYYQGVYGVEEPKTYILSNGLEEGKGSPSGKEAYKMLKENSFPGFKGNVEARYALSGEADVIVTDGYSGNVFLKSTEGTAKIFSSLLKDAFKKNLWSKLGYLHVRSGIKNMTEIFDYKNTGGAMLLGVNGVVVKAHGSSDEIAFESALDVAYKMNKSGVVNKIKEAIN